jgi:hypothetical protein
MFYGAGKRGLVLATAGALVFATLVSLGAVYGLSRPLDPDEFDSEPSTPPRLPKSLTTWLQKIRSYPLN